MDTPAEDITQKQFSMPDGWQADIRWKLPTGRLLRMNEVARWINHIWQLRESGIMTVNNLNHGVIGFAYEHTALFQQNGLR
jgi:hypothetical protein